MFKKLDDTCILLGPVPQTDGLADGRTDIRQTDRRGKPLLGSAS